jgi:hypothetical protein
MKALTLHPALEDFQIYFAVYDVLCEAIFMLICDVD